MFHVCLATPYILRFFGLLFYSSIHDGFPSVRAHTSAFQAPDRDQSPSARAEAAEASLVPGDGCADAEESVVTA